MPPRHNYLSIGFVRSRRTFTHIRRYGDLFKLLLAFLIYNDGIVTVITFAAKYAQQTIGFTSQEIVIMFILMNIIALAGALSFGWLADRIGQKRTILISLCIWTVAIITADLSDSKTASTSWLPWPESAWVPANRSRAASWRCSPPKRTPRVRRIPWFRGQGSGFPRAADVRHDLAADGQPTTRHPGCGRIFHRRTISCSRW